MTVAELIAILQEWPASMEVVIDSAEFGYQALKPRAEMVGDSVDDGEYGWRGPLLDADGSYGDVKPETVRRVLVLSRYKLE